MPAQSKAQQQLMGMAYALKRGEMDPNDASQEVKDLAASMTLKQLKDFAETRHEGLPDKVKEGITPASLSGMGAVKLPTNTEVGSGDVPAGSGDAEEEYKKKRMKRLKTFEQFVNESKLNEATVWAKLNKAAEQRFGEFGFSALSSQEMAELVDMKKADKLADKMFGEFGFDTLSEPEMKELINKNPKIVKV